MHILEGTWQLEILSLLAKSGSYCAVQVLKRAPLMADFKMGSSRVGPEGGIALAKALRTGKKLAYELLRMVRIMH